MSAHATPAEPAPDPGPYAADARHHREILNELIDMGADLARLLHGQATAVGWVSEARPTADVAPPPTSPQDTPATPTPDLTVAFDRVARCVRRTILLARRIAEPLPVPAEHRAAQAAAEHRAAARRKIIRDVEDEIARAARAAPKANDADALHAELHDRLDTPELDDDIRHRSIADIVADICRDLGIAAAGGAKPWKRRTPADVQTLCARAAAHASAPRAAPATPVPPGKPAAPDSRPPRATADPPPPAAKHRPQTPPTGPAPSVATLLRYAARPP